jgi:hypothetical protein
LVIVFAAYLNIGLMQVLYILTLLSIIICQFLHMTSLKYPAIPFALQFTGGLFLVDLYGWILLCPDSCIS